MTNFHALGFLGGILLVAIAIAVMKKRKQTDRYDERQIASRGMAFKAGFATFLVCELGLFTAEIFLGKSIDIFSPGTLHFLVAMAAAMVFAVVSIFKDAYFPVGQKVSMRYFITLGILLNITQTIPDNSFCNLRFSFCLPESSSLRIINYK